MSKGKMIWSNAKKKGTAPCDTASIVHKKPRFNPDREYVEESVKRFLQEGGQIAVITEIRESPWIYGHMSSCYIEDE